MSVAANELIHRYFLGVATESEVRQLEDALLTDQQLQRAFLLHAELDSHLRQELQTAGTCEPGSAVCISEAPTTIWRWASGCAALTVVAIFFLLLLQTSSQRTALAHPSLGELSFSLGASEQSIWAAAATGNLEAVQGQLRKPDVVDIKSECGLTPLHTATLAGQTTVIKLLLDHGASVAVCDSEGNTALHMASFLGRTTVVQILLDAGADPELRNHLGFSCLDNVAISWSEGLEGYYHHLETVLHTELDLEQIRTERPKILRLLASQSRSSLNVAPPVSLWQAAMTGNTAAVEQHIRAGTNLNAKEDFGGSTPLILAAIFGQESVAVILIDAGAELDVQNNSGGSALHEACFFCRPKIVERLLRAGADPDVVNSRGLAPLEVVSMEFGDQLKGVYQHVYHSLGLKLEIEVVRQTRTEIANIIKNWRSQKLSDDSL